MDFHICKNNITIVSQPFNTIPFCGIELWFHFGAADDPEGMNGIAHFLEHLMCSAIREIDPYFYHNMSASTSKDRIRIGGIFGARHANELIKNILDCLINLKVNEFYYNYQKQKVIYEILHVNKAPILEFIGTFESEILSTTGYRNPTFGLREDVEKIEFATSKKYFEEKLIQGLTISLVGGFDIKSIAQYLETLLPIQCQSISSHIKPLEIKDYKKSGNPAGMMLVYDISVMECIAEASIANDYLTFALNDFPIATKQVEYRNHQAVCIYIPDNQFYFEQFAKAARDINVDTYFPIVREYQIDCLNERISWPNQYARSNIESYYYGVDKTNLISNMTSFNFEDVVRRFFSFKPIHIISENNQLLYK